MNERQRSTIRDLFGAEQVEWTDRAIVIDGARYPVIDDVVILIDPAHYTPYVRARLGGAPDGPERADRDASASAAGFAPQIQSSFGAEWTRYGEILPEHRREFEQYFDLVDLEELRGMRVADLGCGAGRWSHFLRESASELVLVDFSDAIFVARKNLADAGNAVFFMADITRLPFRDRSCDLVVSLGVLHHLPVPCLDAVRGLGRLAPRLLIYLYYALDNRPAVYRMLFRPVDLVRRWVSRVPWEGVRRAFARSVTWTVYKPLVAAGRAVAPLGIASKVPLYDFYSGKSSRRIEQDVYDRFFTGIEQRVSRPEIHGLHDVFRTVTISDGLPYWHFLCSSDDPGGRSPGFDRASATP